MSLLVLLENNYLLVVSSCKGKCEGQELSCRALIKLTKFQSLLLQQEFEAFGLRNLLTYMAISKLFHLEY